MQRNLTYLNEDSADDDSDIEGEFWLFIGVHWLWSLEENESSQSLI